MQAKHPEFLTRNQAAEFLTGHGYPIKRRTLDTKVTRGGGPPFRKWGRRVLYEPAALLNWAQAQLAIPLESSSQADAMSRSSRTSFDHRPEK